MKLAVGVCPTISLLRDWSIRFPERKMMLLSSMREIRKRTSFAETSWSSWVGKVTYHLYGKIQITLLVPLVWHFSPFWSLILNLIWFELFLIDKESVFWSLILLLNKSLHFLKPKNSVSKTKISKYNTLSTPFRVSHIIWMTPKQT